MGGGNYAFVHRTFLEYFCAEAIVDRFQVEQTLTLDALKTEIFGHWPDETWHEVLRLVAGRLAPRFVKEILDWLLQQQDPDQSCNHIFIAARCVGEVRNRGELGSTEESVMQCTRDLTKLELGTPSTSMSSLEDIGQSKDVLQKAVELVAYIWKDNKETLPWLKECSQSSHNEDVRSSAVRMLASGWKEDPGSLTIIKEIAQSDEGMHVRVTALAMLSLWAHDPKILKIWEDSAQSDEHEVVRLIAVSLLAGFWKDKPDILPILKDRAQSDEADLVRTFAIKELAGAWKEDPEIQAFLQGL